MPVPESFHKAVKTEELELSDRQLELLELFVDKLLETNKSFNLTAIRDPEEVWHKHVLESLMLARFLPREGAIADIGSGAGLPGIPLAILLPETRFVLIEATGKKARFIEEATGILGLGNVAVFTGRAEVAGQAEEYRERFDAVLSRAVGSLSELIELGLPLLRLEGKLVAVKGSSVEGEIRNATRALSELGGTPPESHSLLPSGASEGRAVVVAKLAPTPEKYPRPPGTPKKRPL